MINEQTISKPIRIIVTGGGTGGHIFPAVAIANALKALHPATEILFVGAKGKMEMEKVPQEGYKIIGLDIAGFNRSAPWKNISLPYKLIKSFLQVKKIFKEFKPDAVIGVGGYASFTVVKYAQQTGVPSFIHESNSFAGKSNILLGKKATRIYVAATGMEKFFPADKILITGNPVRKSIAEKQVDKATALEFFDLDSSKKTVLVTGGSLGARSINEAVAKDIDTLIRNNIQLIWQTGKLFASEAAKYAVDSKNIWVNSFITRMEMAYAAADVVISRSGAMACAELAVMGKPVVFVPYPFAAEDHQTVNAKYFVQEGAALLVADHQAKDHLIDTVVTLLNNETLQKSMQTAMAKLAVLNADEIVAKDVLKEIVKMEN